VQQEVDDKLCLHLATKHAVAQQDMHAIRLAVHARAARQEHDQLFHIKDHRVQIVELLLQLFQNMCVFTSEAEAFQKTYF
jgi:hypothetical protein